jgi:hypothetical protein
MKQMLEAISPDYKSYFLSVSKRSILTREDQNMSAGNKLFLLASIHASTLSFPSLILSLCSIPNPTNSLLYTDPKGFERIVATHPGRFFHDIMFFTVALFSVGYYRLYKDGPSQQPLMLLFGAFAKLILVFCFVRAWLDNMATSLTMALATVPDGVMGLMYLKIWIDLGCPWSPGQVKNVVKSDSKGNGKKI